MNWTTEKPTKPGWYWYKGPFCFHGQRHDGGASLFRVVEELGELEGRAAGYDGTLYLDSMPGQFAGPIPEPGQFAALEAEAAADESTGCMMGGDGWPAGIRYALKKLGIESKIPEPGEADDPLKSLKSYGLPRRLFEE